MEQKMGSDTENLISVIIPVYNVEAYVERCVTSVQNQTYKNLEVIIVDDGSTDRSGEICDSLSAADRRLKVIHKVNGGQSSARNAGIAAAHGNYIAFVDSDDFIHEEYISFMYGIAIESGAQIVICDYEKGNKSEFSVNISDNSYDMYTSSQMLKNWHAGLCAQETTPCNKLILRELLIKMRFCYPEGVYYEDVRTTHLLVEAADEVAVTKRKLYYYYQRKNSTTKRLKNEKNIRDNLTAQDIRLAFFMERGYEEAAHRLVIGRQKFYMLMICMSDSKELIRQIQKLFLGSYKVLMGFQETSWIDKFMFCIFKVIFIHGVTRREIVNDI
ncbi:MAG: glycosyltransferase family 2 protein [Lachnospiraceae bacterium]|jgi:glycosyltransferase involved in cell wall biosynthesis|nr:glycosyltransferase family 2 protein [Lachnospiraceae bacterium]